MNFKYNWNAKKKKTQRLDDNIVNPGALKGYCMFCFVLFCFASFFLIWNIENHVHLWLLSTCTCITELKLLCEGYYNIFNCLKEGTLNNFTLPKKTRMEY